MIFLKYIILLTIFLGTSYIGFLFSRKYRNRVNELREIKEVISILENKIRFTYEPLGEIFDEIYNMVESKKNIANVFKQLKNNMKDYNVKISWEMALENSKTNLNLNKEDINIIKSLGKLLRENRYRWTNK